MSLPIVPRAVGFLQLHMNTSAVHALTRRKPSRSLVFSEQRGLLGVEPRVELAQRSLFVGAAAAARVGGSVMVSVSKG